MAKLLEHTGVQVARVQVGNDIMSLDMQCCSLTALKADEELLGLWYAPVSTPGLCCGI